MARHELPLERRTLHGYFSRELPPVLTVDSGDTVVFETLESSWRVDPGTLFEPRDSELDSGHALCGPVEVRGAHAGQTLGVEIGEVRVGSWGASPVGDDVLIWTLDADAGTGRDQHGREVTLRPFLGVLGMPPPDAGRHSTTPPRVWGGNIDCKELVAGATVFLPMPVDGALFSAGDGHALQADGEVSGVAIECPLERAELTLTVLDEAPLRTPFARAGEAWLTFGFDEDLDRAAELATDAMLQLMKREHGLDRDDALALASLVVDLRITQVVNEVKGVHAVLPDDGVRI